MSAYEWCPPVGPCGTAHLDVRRCADSVVKTFCAFSSLPILWKMKKCRIYMRDYYALNVLLAGHFSLQSRLGGNCFNPHKLKIEFTKWGTMYDYPKSPLSSEV